MFGFEKLLSGFAPKKGLAILAANIEQRLGHPVTKYEMRLFCDDLKIDFLVYLPANIELANLEPATAFKYNNEKRCHLYKFTDGEKLSKVILYVIKPQLPDTYKLQYVIVKYDGDEPVICEAYGENNGNKEKQTITL